MDFWGAGTAFGSESLEAAHCAQAEEDPTGRTAAVSVRKHTWALRGVGTHGGGWGWGWRWRGSRWDQEQDYGYVLAIVLKTVSFF